ncbi:hypothetical protein ACFV8E_31035 [Streptomyces sp. NPDC059849]
MAGYLGIPDGYRYYVDRIPLETLADVCDGFALLQSRRIVRRAPAGIAG